MQRIKNPTVKLCISPNVMRCFMLKLCSPSQRSGVSCYGPPLVRVFLRTSPVCFPRSIVDALIGAIAQTTAKAFPRICPLLIYGYRSGESISYNSLSALSRPLSLSRSLAPHLNIEFNPPITTQDHTNTHTHTHT